MATPNRIEVLTTRQHLTYFCSRFLAYALPLLLFLVTTSFYLKTYDSAQVKITFTQIGTTMLLFVWLTKMLLEGKIPFSKEDLVFVGPFIAFLGSGLIAYAHSPFKTWALEETLRRVFYMVIALITIAEFRSDERMRRLWRWLLAAAWASIGYGVLQYIDQRYFPGSNVTGIDPFIWRGAFGPRVFSTFGNPNFYGNFLVIITPLILASVLKEKGSLARPFIVLGVTLMLVLVIDNMTLKRLGGFPPSMSIVVGALVIALLAGFFVACLYRVGPSGTLPMTLILFACLFVNLYATETKGAWVGFTAAMAATLWLIVEFFFHLDEIELDPKKYFVLSVSLITLFGLVISVMVASFVVPLFKGQISQIGFSILWIPTLIAAIVSVLISLWVVKKPWNLRKMVYGFLVLFVIIMGTGVLQFAKTRLLSVSFRLFTWISTWEMVRTEPLFGNGVGTFKVIYPAYRRPQIITLECKSNTETDHSEDEYIEVWQDEGLFGFGILLWMIATALTCGLKLLGLYSKIQVPDQRKKRGLTVQNDPRSYEVLGILGAYIGALFHWFVDVSIRFVSSGVFSGLLPGLLVAYARNHNNPVRHEVRLGYERWVRVAVAGFWTIVFLALGLELVPQSMIEGGDTTDGQIWLFAILAGAVVYILLELLELGNSPQQKVDFSEQYSVRDPADYPMPLRSGVILVLAVVSLYWMRDFKRQFDADVHHNLAIFFSKQGIWTKAPKYDAQMMNFPPDIRKVYKECGGALDHYEQVEKNNPAFPMAWYFTGNVYNDWGSQAFSESLQARQKGDMVEAERQRVRALEMWDKSEKAYTDLKKIAPNYVQTHHQMGLLDTKRAELYNQYGDSVKSQVYYQEAYRNFTLYHDLDPVFPPNYDRMIQILVMQNKFEEAVKLLKQAIYYNDVVAKSILAFGFPDRVSDLSLNLAKTLYTWALRLSPNPFNPKLPQIDESLKYFQLAADSYPSNAEAWKGLGFLQGKMGMAHDAQISLQKAYSLNPKDPELKSAAPVP